MGGLKSVYRVFVKNKMYSNYTSSGGSINWIGRPKHEIFVTALAAIFDPPSDPLLPKVDTKEATLSREFLTISSHY